MSKKLWKKTLPILEAAEKEHNPTDYKYYEIEKNLINPESKVNSIIEILQNEIYENLKWKIEESFSWLDPEFLHLAEITFWDLEHSYWWNRLFIKSKIMNAIKDKKEFSYASYDINSMWISNNLSKSLWNLRILELWLISHEIVKYLKNLWYEETFFSRN